MKRLFTLFVGLCVALAVLACSFGPTLVTNSESPSVKVNTAVPLKPTAKSGGSEPTKKSANPVAAQPQVLSSSQLDATLPDLYDRVNPGVVAILIVGDQGGGLGSGFVFDTKGNIVTNYHVVEGAKDLEVDFSSGLKVRGTVIGTDLDSDLAVVKVNVPADQLVPLTLGDSDIVRVGEQVVAMGNPFGLSGTMTLGIVSAKGRTLDSMRQSSSGGYFSSGDIIQTDASINPGNSGGPLINLKGEVIGINRAIRTTSTTAGGEPINSGIGFAVPINIVKRVAPMLVKSGKYDYPYLGISFHPNMSLLDFEAIGAKQTSGAYIADVTPGGPGEQAGLRAGKRKTDIQGLNAGGDIVIAVETREVREFGDLIGYILENKSPGDKVTVTILRDNEKKEVVITLGKRP
jgi:S1-C subfamily serine protease